MTADTWNWPPSADLPSALGDPFKWLERAKNVSVTATGLVVGRKSLLTYFSFAETTGVSTAVVQLFNGTSATGTPVFTINLAANESSREFPPWPWVSFSSGIFANIVSGTVTGSVGTLTPSES